MKLPPRLSIHRLKALWRKETLQWIREPLLLLIFFSAVTLQLILFGYSVNSKPQGISLILLDLDRTYLSRDLIRVLQLGKTFHLPYMARDEGEIGSSLKRGDVQAALIIPSNFSEKVKGNQAPQLKLYLDGTQASTAGPAKGEIFNRLEHFFRKPKTGANQGNNETPSPSSSSSHEIQAHYKILHNPELKDSFFMVPGIIGAILFLIITAISAASFTREKESGTLASVQMSPIQPMEFLLGKTAPLFLISAFFAAIGFVVGSLWFRIPFSGSLPLLLLASFCFIVFCIGLGFISACVSKTQLQGVMTTLFFTTPGIFLSGSMGQTDVWWPSFLKSLSLLNPLYYYVKLCRHVLIAEAGWARGWVWLLALAISMMIIVGFSILLSRRFFVEKS